MRARLSPRRRLRSLVVGLAAAATLLPVAPAAQAQGTTLRDPAGDSRASAAGDITRVRLAYPGRKILVKVRTRNYTPTYHVMLDVNRKSRFDFKATWYDEDWAYGARPTVSITDRRGRRKCTATWRYQDDGRVLFFAVPRWCLGRPGQVRVRAMSFPNAQDDDWRPFDRTGWTRFVRRG